MASNNEVVTENIQKQLRMNNQLLSTFQEMLLECRKHTRSEHVQIAKRLKALENQQAKILTLLEGQNKKQSPCE